ncbi:MAG: peptidoglycan-binding domain-containing protein [Pseudomonadota bacterium]
MMRGMVVLAAGAALMVSGCGQTVGDRGLSGAGIGAGAGAVVGAVTGLSILEGVALGAVAGGLAGALTDSEFLNLGDPIWATNSQDANQAATARIQAGLSRLGYNPGPVDGVKGARTSRAIRAYQRDNALLVDGRATFELAEHIDGQLRG